MSTNIAILENRVTDIDKSLNLILAKLIQIKEQGQ